MERQDVMVAIKAGKIAEMYEARRLPCMAVIFLAVLFFIGNGWSACTTQNVNWCLVKTYNKSCVEYYDCDNVNKFCNIQQFDYTQSNGKCYSTEVYCKGKQVSCSTQCQADSVANYQPCLDRGGTWNADSCSCSEPPPSSSSQDNHSSSSQDDESSSSQAKSSSSSAPGESSSSVDCTGNRQCCDSLNTYRPVEYDTLDLGCGALQIQYGQNGEPPSACEEQHSYYADGSVAQTYYLCNGLFYIRVCATEYTYDGTGKCEPIPTTDCYEVTDWERSRTECQDVRCDLYWENELHSLSYNSSTKCFTGKYRKMSYIVCSNGTRSFPSYGSMQDYKVCDPYLDSLGQDIGKYTAGTNSGGPGVDGNGEPVSNSGGLGLGGSGGSGGWGGGTGGAVSGGGSGGSGSTGSAGTGDGSGDGLGDDGGLSDIPANGYVPVTETDPETGEVTVVKNSEGGDSLVPVVKTYSVRCLGVSGGVATLTDGNSTWTCQDVQSCVQAELKYKLGTGCGAPVTDGVVPDYSTTTPSITWGDSVKTDAETGAKDYTDALNNLSKTATWFYNFFAFPSDYPDFSSAVNAVVSSVNSGHVLDRSHLDSIYDDSKTRLWKAVFGDDLSNVSAISDSIYSLRVAVGDIVPEVRTVSTAVQSASSTVSLAVGDAASVIRSTITNAATTVTNGVDAAATSIVGAVQGTRDSLMSNTGRVADSLHGIRVAVEGVGARLDTGGVTHSQLDAIRTNTATANGLLSNYYNMVHEQNLLQDSYYRSIQDSAGSTNAILRDIREALGATPSSSATASSSSAVAEVDTTYADTVDYSFGDGWVESDSLESLAMSDSLDSLGSRASRFRATMDSVFAHVDSVRADTNNNWIAMDSIYKWHKDTTAIRQKFSNFWLPSQVSSQCFVCTYNERWYKWDVDLRFDAANIHGFNLCEFIRILVRIATTIFIIFSTISAFIRAFGGGGGGN